MVRSITCTLCNTEIEPKGTRVVDCPECGETYRLPFAVGKGGSSSAPRPETEKTTEQKAIEFYQAVGCAVYKTSQAQKPVGMSKGIPDLIVFAGDYSKAPAPAWYHEVKRPGRDPRQGQSPEQATFEQHCEAAGIPYILGDATAAAQFLGFEV